MGGRSALLLAKSTYISLLTVKNYDARVTKSNSFAVVGINHGVCFGGGGTSPSFLFRRERERRGRKCKRTNVRALLGPVQCDTLFAFLLVGIWDVFF